VTTPAEPAEPAPTGPVVMVTPRWRRDGGVATHVMASAGALAARGVEVHVVARVVEPGEHVEGVQVHESPGLLDGALSAEQRLAGTLGAAPAVVHLHQFEDPDVAAAIRRHAPLVLSMHGYSACTSGVHYFRPGQECERAHGPGCVPNLIGRGCAHTRDPSWLPGSYRHASRAVRLLRAADLAISYSGVIDRHLATNGATRRAVVPLFATLEPVRAGGHEARRRVLFAGRLVRAKGLQVLLRAMRELDAELLVCGDGHERARMESLASRLGVASRATFRGWLAPSELAGELAEASVVAMPSLWPEPFGLIGIEAFSCGRPVVASDTGGVREWLEPGVSGLAVAPGRAGALSEALASLLADPARQARMGEAGGRSVAARFTAAHHVEALLRAYAAARSAWESARGG
jgi:glycosyltransferase involved in cell wall biosynthesis